MIRFFIVSLFIFSIVGCSRMEFVQNGATSYQIASVEGSEKVITVEKDSAFYFWGNLPQKSIIDLDKVFFEEGVHAPSMVKIERVTNFTNAFLMIVTLGMYLPETYRISVYSKGITR